MDKVLRKKEIKHRSNFPNSLKETNKNLGMTITEEQKDLSNENSEIQQKLRKKKILRYIWKHK